MNMFWMMQENRSEMKISSSSKAMQRVVATNITEPATYPNLTSLFHLTKSHPRKSIEKIGFY
jgi:hypothetical protein